MYQQAVQLYENLVQVVPVITKIIEPDQSLILEEEDDLKEVLSEVIDNINNVTETTINVPKENMLSPNEVVYQKDILLPVGVEDEYKEEINEDVIQYEIPVARYIDLSLIEELMKLQEKEKDIQEIFDLIGEGEVRLKDSTKKSIILLGRTGAGKSTLVYDFGERPLHAFRDDSTGNMLVDSHETIVGINISHRAESETKIPGRLEIKGRTIWDFPGYNDTSIKQEIANAFYMKRVCMNSEELKFILVMSEAAITQDKGINAIEIMKQTIKLFSDLKILDGSISLIVTQVTYGKNSLHLKNNLQKIIDENPMVKDDIEIKQLLSYFSKSIHVMPIPITEGLVSSSGILSKIEDSTNYLAPVPGLVKVAISERSMPYVAGLLSVAEGSFLQVASLIIDAIKDANKCMSLNTDNIFLNSSDVIEKWLPKSFSSNRSQNKQEIRKDKLEGLDQLNDLINVLPIEFNLQNIKSSIVSVLNVFHKYASNETLQHHIQKYMYVFEQQTEYVKFLSESCADTPTVYSAIFQMMEECKGSLHSQLKQQLMSLKLEDNSDFTYYSKVIKYLDHYPEEIVCVKIKAKAYDYLGELYKLTGNPDRALIYFSKALQTDNTLKETYKKIGNLFLTLTPPNYTAAIKYFKAIDDSYHVKNCFKKLEELDPLDCKLKATIGDYHVQIGLYTAALKYYSYAAGLSEDIQFKNEMANKRINILQNQAALLTGAVDALVTQIDTGNFCKYDEVKISDLVSLEHTATELVGEGFHID